MRRRILSIVLICSLLLTSAPLVYGEAGTNTAEVKGADIEVVDFWKGKDGSTVVILQDSTTATTSPEGSARGVTGKGNPFFIDDRGNTFTVGVKGDVYLDKADGTTEIYIQKDRDGFLAGSVVILYPDGKRSYRDPEGLVRSWDRDGKNQEIYFTLGEEKLSLSDEGVYSEGIITDSNGSKFEVKKDGSIIADLKNTSYEYFPKEEGDTYRETDKSTGYQLQMEPKKVAFTYPNGVQEEFIYQGGEPFKSLVESNPFVATVFRDYKGIEIDNLLVGTLGLENSDFTQDYEILHRITHEKSQEKIEHKIIGKRDEKTGVMTVSEEVSLVDSQGKPVNEKDTSEASIHLEDGSTLSLKVKKQGKGELVATGTSGESIVLSNGGRSLTYRNEKTDQTFKVEGGEILNGRIDDGAQKITSKGGEFEWYDYKSGNYVRKHRDGSSTVFAKGAGGVTIEIDPLGVAKITPGDSIPTAMLFDETKDYFTAVASDTSGGSLDFTEDNLVVKSGEVEVELSIVDLTGDNRLTVKEAKEVVGKNAPTEDVSIKNYDINISGLDGNMGIIDIRIPYDKSIIEKGQSPSNCVTAAYYNPETQEYEQVSYTVDESSETVLVHAEHLSVYSLFTFKNENKRNAYCYVNTWNISSAINSLGIENASEVLQEYMDLGGQPGNLALEAGIEFVNDTTGLLGNTFTIFTELISRGSEHLGKLTNALTHLGVVGAIHQAIVDYSSGNDAVFLSNAMKNISYYVVGKFGSSVAKIASVGVFAVDYSLNKFATTAISNRNAAFKKAYDRYYQEQYGSGIYRMMYHRFYDAYQQNVAELGDRDAFKAKVDKIIDDHLNEFWKDYSAISTSASQKGISGAGGRGYSDEMAKEITKAAKVEFVQMMQPVFSKLNKDIADAQYKEIADKLEEIKELLNEIYIIDVVENLREGEEEYSYAGGTWMFDPIREGADKSSFTGKLDDRGRAQFDITLLGYVTAGGPLEIKFFRKDNPVENNTPDYSHPFELSSTYINITLVGPEPENIFPTIDQIVGVYDVTVSATGYGSMQDIVNIYKSGDDTFTLEDIRNCVYDPETGFVILPVLGTCYFTMDENRIYLVFSYYDSDEELNLHIRGSKPR